MKIVYMGTPDFAVPPLRALVKAGYEVVGVVTQPDKPKGRSKTLLPPPVKEEALKYNIPVYQPLRVWMLEYPCLTSSDIQRSGSYSAGGH